MSAGSIGKAALILTTSDSGLSRGLDGAYNRLQSFKTSLSSSFGKLSLAGGVTALLGGGKIVGDLIGSIREKADLSKEARALGMPVAAFQALKAAAETANVDVGGLKEGLINMNSKISEAAAGNKDLSASFARVGLDAKSLKGLTLDQQFLSVADALGQVPNAGDRAQLALKLLGEEAGKKLLPVLAQGGDAVRKFAAEQERTGAALSQSDAARIEAAKSALPRIASSFDGIWTRIVVAAAPVIERVAGVATKILARLQPAFKFFADLFSTYYEVLGAVLGEILDLGGDILQELGNFLGELFDVGEMRSTRDYVLDFFQAIGIAGGYVWDALKAGAGGVVQALVWISEGADGVREALLQLIEAAGELPEELGGNLFKSMGEQLRAWDVKGKQMREDLKAWGQRQIDAFGGSEVKVRGWFDRLRVGAGEVKGAAEALNGAAANLGMAWKDNKALELGSKEEFSARVKFEFNAEQDKQLAEQRAIVRNTGKTVEAVSGLADKFTRLFGGGI